MTEIELLDEIVVWLDTLSEVEYQRVVVLLDRLAVLGSTARRITFRFTQDGRIVLLTTFRKQRQSESAEVRRARKVAAADAGIHP